MTDDIADMDPDEIEDEQERLEKEIVEHERRLRGLLIEERRKRVELRCLEYVEFRIACEEAVEDKPVFYPETDPLGN